MGFDLYGAGKAAMALVGNDGTNQSSLPMNSRKSLWAEQIRGSFSLLYPHMHEAYANRDELNMAIKLAFKTHDMTNPHTGDRPGNTLIMDTPLIPRERLYTYGITPTKSTDPERQTASSMEAINTSVLIKADSTVTSYGV